MKKFFLAVVIVLSFFSSSFATIRRVGFFGIPLANIDYSTFAAAYTAAASGDTILMFPNTSLNGTLTKKLTIIGPGNWIDPTTTPKGNANEQANPAEATTSSLAFSPGSDGSVVMGFHGGSYYISANNITLRRNRDLSVEISYNVAGNIPLTVNNIQLLENYELIVADYFSNGSSTTNLIISNNLINNFYLNNADTHTGDITNNDWVYDATATTTDGGSTTFSAPASGIGFGNGAFLFQNNITLSYTNTTSSFNYFYFVDAGNVVFNYNLITQSTNASGLTSNGTGNVVITLANVPSVFAAFPLIGSSTGDARYQLGASSAALTIGSGSTPIGMFAGTSPYKLSTIPTIPSIYSISSPQGNNPSGSTIQINLSTRGNN